VAQGASTILATNRETLAIARRFGARSVDFFHDTGIDTSLVGDQGHRDWSERTFQLVWVGRLFPRKGLRIALEALSHVPPDVPCLLTVVGDGPERSRLIATAKSLGVDGRVNWRGQVPWAEALDAIDSSHALLFTSLRDSSGAQLLEAQARGLPVITLDHQGAADHVPDDAGIKVSVSTPRQVVQDLARAITAASRDRPRLAVLSQNAVAWASTQTWDQKAARMEGIYQRLLNLKA